MHTYIILTVIYQVNLGTPVTSLIITGPPTHSVGGTD